jgi:thiamine kinase-like enzyme
MAYALLLLVACEAAFVRPPSGLAGHRVVRRRSLPAHPQCALPSIGEAAVGSILRKADLTAVHEEESSTLRLTEMSAGFCNWVYRAEVEGSPRPVVVKLFSPLAKLRITPMKRGEGDETASAEGFGPRLLYRSTEGLITEYIEGETLTERDMHAPSSSLPALIAPRLAAYHGTRSCGSNPILWAFLDAMLESIAKAPSALPAGLTVEGVRGEVDRMRRRCDALSLPTVRGHGDLKPSNVMWRRGGGAGGAGAAADGDITFIDFELAGCHYRGFDLFKLFRTNGAFSQANMRAFLQKYVRHTRAASASAPHLSVESNHAESLMVDELQAEVRRPAARHLSPRTAHPRPHPRPRSHTPACGLRDRPAPCALGATGLRGRVPHMARGGGLLPLRDV